MDLLFRSDRTVSSSLKHLFSSQGSVGESAGVYVLVQTGSCPLEFVLVGLSGRLGL